MSMTETLELFPLFDVETEADAPRVTAAISANLAVLGTPDAIGGSGAVAIYTYSEASNGWGYVGVLSGSKIAGSEQVRGMGSSVAVFGDTIVVGAEGDRSTPGRVFILRAPYGEWTYAAIPVVSQLTYEGSRPGDLFGAAVAHCSDGTDDYIVVGAPAVEPPAGPFGPGQLFVYKGLDASNTPWSTSTVANPDPSGTEDDRFGAAVAISSAADGTLVIAAGAPGAREGQGAAYAGRTAQAGTWSGPLKFAALVPSSADGSASVGFGTSVALTGGSVLAVGGPGTTGPGGEPEAVGAVWVFEADGGAFEGAGTRLPGGAAEAGFGRSVAFAETAPGERAPFLVVGAPGGPVSEAYRYADTGDGWKAEQQLASYGGRPGNRFGWSVAASSFQHGSWTFVGAPGVPRSKQGSGGFIFVDGEPVPAWMDAPGLMGESPLRWGGLPTDWWKKYTPEIPKYL